MNLDELQKVVDGLSWMAERFAELPEGRSEAVQAALYLKHTQLFVQEYMLNVARGVDAYDALLAAAKGTTDLSE